MRKFITLLLVLANIFFVNIVNAAVPNSSHPTTFLGPTITSSYTTLPSEYSAVSILGELGVQNIRASATAGWAFGRNQRVKFSAEYLIQKIVYSFFSGNTGQWMTQGAIGGMYQYDLDFLSSVPQINVQAFYSHAPSKTLSTIAGRYLISPGIYQNFVNMRHIAGSNAAGVASGLDMNTWRGGAIGLDLNYDNVRYQKIYSPNENAQGFGVTGRLKQAVTNNVTVGLQAEIRKPFNNYQADVVWVDPVQFEGWIFDVSGSYTEGKKTLPNTFNFGVSGHFICDRPLQSAAKQKSNAVNFIMQRPASQLASWVSTPAVYMPQVLAVPDQANRLTQICSIPTAPGLLPDLVGISTVTTVAAAAAFNGAPLTFSVATSVPTSGTVVIDPATGVVTITPGVTDENFVITVTASNECGVAATTFGVSILA